MEIHSRHLRNPDIVTAPVGGGLMMMDITCDSYYSLDSLGYRVWQLLETPRSLEEICLLLTAEYEVDLPTCIAQIGTLQQDLLDEKMISPVDSGTAQPQPKELGFFANIAEWLSR